MESITYKEVLESIDRGDIFSCVVVSYDRKRKTGGELIEYEQVRISQPRKRTDRPQTSQEKLISQLEELRRKPNHFRNYTRNITLLQQGMNTDLIKKIHPPLIVEFNGKTVLP